MEFFSLQETWPLKSAEMLEDIVFKKQKITLKFGLIIRDTDLI